MKAPRMLNMINFRKNLIIWKTSYPNTILAVKMNRSVFVVLLEQSIHIHCSKSMSTRHIIHDTPHNPKGLSALSSNEDLPWLAYPVSPESGDIQLFDFVQFRNGPVIRAHASPVAEMSFNPAGSLLATASNKGTLIRVFDLDGRKLYEFRRSMRRYATIYSIAFSADSDLLVVSSSTETVHIFKLDDENLIRSDSSSGSSGQQALGSHPPSPTEAEGGEADNSWFGYLGSLLNASSTYLPTTMSEMWTQPRSFAIARLHFSNIKTVCAAVTIHRKSYLLVVAANGYMYVYRIDARRGGECELIKQHELDKSSPLDSPKHGAKTPTTTTYAQMAKEEASGSASDDLPTTLELGGGDPPVGSPLDYSGEFPSMQ